MLILIKALEYKEGLKEPDASKNDIKLVKNDSLDNLNKYLGKYSIGGDIFDIKKKRGHFFFKQSGQAIYLIPNNHGSFTPKLKLLGIIPIKLKEQELNFKTIGDNDYLAFKNEALFGVKIANYTINEEWKKKTGNYELLNQGNDKFYPENISLVIDHDILSFKLKYFGTKLALVLQTQNNNEAICLGIGRNGMETLYFTKDDKGEDVLHYSGYQFKLKKEETKKEK